MTSTEEETFNRLRKPAFDQLEVIISNNSELISTDPTALIDILRQHEWTLGEYINCFLSQWGVK